MSTLALMPSADASQDDRNRATRSLLALSFFTADMRAGIGPFLGVFLQQHGWSTGPIGTVMTLGGVAGMVMTVPAGAFIDYTDKKRLSRRHHRHLHGDGLLPDPAFAIGRGGDREPSRDRDRRRRDRPRGRRDDARRRQPEGLQPAERAQPGLEPRRQQDRGGTVGLSRLALRHAGDLLSCGAVRGVRDHLGPVDPGSRHRSSGGTRLGERRPSGSRRSGRGLQGTEPQQADAVARRTTADFFDTIGARRPTW